MSKTVIKLDKKEIGNLLKSDDVYKAIQEEAERIKATAEAKSGEEWATRKTMTDRVGVNVYPETEEAARENKKNNTALKALWNW